MKHLLLSLIFNLILLSTAQAQSSLQGTWQLVEINGTPLNDSEMVAVCSDDYFMFGHYGKDGSFISAGGGSHQVRNNEYQQVYDFNTENSQLVRNPVSYTYHMEGDRVTLEGNQTKMVWQKTDNSTTPLTGVWRFATRVDENGNVGERREPGPRQTIKILSGDRFQWAAFNYETREFMGTGGGTYEATAGKYTEQIVFFSRDNSRVGNSLTFQFERKGDDWFHKGKSSKGDPLHEVWEKAR